jgi:hypothetical protein
MDSIYTRKIVAEQQRLVMRIDEFSVAAVANLYVPDDGSGYFCKQINGVIMASDVSIWGDFNENSDLLDPVEDATHVIWYPK